MLFLLQTKTELNIEYLIIKDLIHREKYIHSYIDITLNQLIQSKEDYKKAIPVGTIECIAHYNGNPLILPDLALINKANGLYQLEDNAPKSYTMDIMVTGEGTSIIEVHNFTSVGLYNTVWGTNLLYAYRDGIDYLLNCNKPIKTF